MLASIGYLFGYLWMAALLAFPFLAGITVWSLVTPARRWQGCLMLVTGAIGIVAASAIYVVLPLGGNQSFSQTTFRGWSLATASGFSLGSLPSWLWRHNV